MASKSDWIVNLDTIVSAENHFTVLGMEVPTVDPLGRAVWPFGAEDVHRNFLEILKCAFCIDSHRNDQGLSQACSILSPRQDCLSRH